ncbi:MAG: phosphate ABC transporter substrate-binding protein [Anaerolineae bacterium]|nr:phosphate ABC transporter substrate-binding protein [Anaerolineae bacterium]
MRYVNQFLWLMLLACIISACGATITPPTPLSLKAVGSTSVAPLFIELSEAYSREHPHVSFNIDQGGSRLGQRLVESGEAEIGLVSFTPEQLADGFRLVPIGRDGIAIIVHPDNDITGLSIIDLRRIFSGEILEWQTTGGSARSIQIVSREDGSGTRTAFERRVMDDQTVASTAIVLPNSQAIIDFVASTPSAIGYVSAALMDDSVRSVPIEGVLPTVESLDIYPLSRNLALIVPEQSSAEINQLLKFIASPAGQQIVSQRWALIR